MDYLKSIIAGLLSGFILFVSYKTGFSFFSFFFLVPFLAISAFYQTKRVLILLSALSFLITWHALNLQFLFSFSYSFLNRVAPLGIVLFIIVGILPFLFLILNTRYKVALFVCSWGLIEILYMRWDFSSPFSSLGIVLGGSPQLIQWYQFTGVTGGSLWILSINFLLYNSIDAKVFSNPQKRCLLWMFLFVFLIPVSLSSFFYLFKKEKNEVRNVRVFSFSSSEDEMAIWQRVKLLFDSVDANKYIDYNVLPELIVSLNNQKVESHDNLVYLRELACSSRTNSVYVLGADLFAWQNQQVLAVSIACDKIQQRNKELLVPFGERIPLSGVLSKLKFINEKNPYPYISSQNGDEVFCQGVDKFHVSVCFESFFENHVARYLNDEVGVIFVIAREPFVYNRHYRDLTLLLTRVQAITFQKDIARSSWIGVSCIVKANGQIINSVYNENQIVESEIDFSKGISFYGKYGVYVNHICLLLLFLVFCFISIYSYVNNRSR
ncbi:hypothetical protein [Alkaliflexus imshenetskii]|uniref:hypothetical protein n=1 Tax=Alkaliflexus imshenetskii TaxID=286730 RepID=UPI000479FB17|nr:hypothetical protein [Alkaliflexus imshenetskii]